MSLMRRIGRTVMNPRDAAATKVFEAMKMEGAFADWLAEKEVIHHNNYRALFEAGALDRSWNSWQSARSFKGQWGSL
jgi:hypothetical protein